MSVDLDDLYDTYKAARGAYEAVATEENRAAYKEAKRAFAVLRTQLRVGEENDPSHPRPGAGAPAVVVINEENV